METGDLQYVLKIASRNSYEQKYIVLDDTCANTRHYTSEQCCCIPCCIHNVYDASIRWYIHVKLGSCEPLVKGRWHLN